MLVRDRRLAVVPVDRVIRVDARPRVAALDGESLPGGLLPLPQLAVSVRLLRAVPVAAVRAGSRWPWPVVPWGRCR